MKKIEDSKQKLLDVATKLFAHKSFAEVSTREICKEANVNLCMISYYFGGKQELYNHNTKQATKRVEQCRQQVKYSFGKELPSIGLSANYPGIKVPKLDNFELKKALLFFRFSLIMKRIYC